jgi:hypothetical protein
MLNLPRKTAFFYRDPAKMAGFFASGSGIRQRLGRIRAAKEQRFPIRLDRFA